MNSISQKRQIKCSICGYMYISQYKDHHQKCHFKETPYSCKICLMSFKRSAEFKLHYETHEIIPNTESTVAYVATKYYTCEKCDCIYTDFEEFQHHSQTEHPAEEIDVVTNEPVDVFKLPSEPKVKIVKFDLIYPENIEIIDEEANSFKCAVCNIEYSLLSSLQLHIKRSHQDQGTIDRNNRKRERGKQYHCDQCEKKYYTASALKEHLRIHTGER